MTRLVRDRVSWLLYAQQGVFGYFLYGAPAAVGLLRDELGMSQTVAGLYGPALAVGTMIGGALFPHLMRRMRQNIVLATGLTGLATGVALLCLVPSVPGTLAACAIAATFATLVVNGVSTALTVRHGAASPAAISEANALSAGMGFIAPLLIDITIRMGIGWRGGLSVTIALACAVAAVTVRMTKRLGARTSVAPPPPREPVGARLPRRYWLAWICLLAVGSVETCLTLWAPEQLRERTGLAPGTATAGISALLAGMFIGRLAGGRLAVRFRTAPLLCAALVLSVAGFGVFWATGTPWLALAGLLCCGLGMSLHYPLGVALAMQASDGRPELAMSRNSFGSALGLGVVPFLLGALADLVGIHLAFSLVPLCLVVAILAVGQLAWLQRRATKPREGLSSANQTYQGQVSTTGA